MSEESDMSMQAPTWIKWFCGLQEHQYFCEIDVGFILDPFNHYLLQDRFPHLSDLVKLIVRPYPPEEDELERDSFIKLHQDASELYGLLHARFIVTPLGLGLMREKMLIGRFGSCPKVYCQNNKVIPIGLCNTPKTSRVKLYCPRCKQVYFPKRKADIDGAYFGCSFPQILLKAYPDLAPTKKSGTFEPKIYGFKVKDENLTVEPTRSKNKSLTKENDVNNQESKRKALGTVNK